MEYNLMDDIETIFYSIFLEVHTTLDAFLYMFNKDFDATRPVRCVEVAEGEAFSFAAPPGTVMAAFSRKAITGGRVAGGLETCKTLRWSFGDIDLISFGDFIEDLSNWGLSVQVVYALGMVFGRLLAVLVCAV